MTNEEKTENIISKYETKYNDTSDLLWTDIKDAVLEMAQWKDEQNAEAKELLHLCYNTIPGITALDTSEEIAKARKSHDSSLIKRIELFMYNNQQQNN